MSSNIRIEKVCQFCSSKFIARTTKTKFCSNGCSSLAYRQAARREKIEIEKVEASITGKIRTKVPFLELAGKEPLTITAASV